MVVESGAKRANRLVAEVLDIIPNYTSGRGSFNSFPKLGYNARHPSDWQREFLQLLAPANLDSFGEHSGDIRGLVHFHNDLTLAQLPLPIYQSSDGSTQLFPVSLLSTTLGYALFEMVVRILWTGGRDGPSSLDRLLMKFESNCAIPELAISLRRLNEAMIYAEDNGQSNLYRRLKKGRDQLLHGNVLRAVEFEGSLLVLLIDLVVLHAIKDQLERQTGATGCTP